MKKIILYITTAILSLSFTANGINAQRVQIKTEQPRSRSEETRQLNDRILQINSIDKSTLGKDERKALRKELRSIKRRIGGGFYISAGAIIVIIVLLLVFL